MRIDGLENRVAYLESLILKNQEHFLDLQDQIIKVVSIIAAHRQVLSGESSQNQPDTKGSGE